MSRQEIHDANISEGGTDEASQQVQGQGLSRCNLLVGSAGLTVGSMVGASAFVAQSDQLGAGFHMRPTARLGNRIYSANPSHPGMVDASENPANVPLPITRIEPATVRIELEVIEIEVHLDTKSRFRFWTFNGTLPGPSQRIRVGDTVEVYLKNNEDSWFAQNVDFHAVNGPGGGASLGAPGPGEDYSFKFKALKPGPYVYHCAVSPVALHIANAMYGLILVEPEADLPPVDHEFYVMQGEIYTAEPFASFGVLNESYDKLIDERAEYLVFNGHVGALTDHYPLQAKVGETIRIYFGVGGPNYTSAFQVIGEIFDKAHLHGALISPPLESMQSIVAPPGGSGIVEFKCEVPGHSCWSITRCRAPSAVSLATSSSRATKARTYSRHWTRHPAPRIQTIPSDLAALAANRGGENPNIEIERKEKANST